MVDLYILKNWSRYLLLSDAHLYRIRVTMGFHLVLAKVTESMVVQDRRHCLLWFKGDGVNVQHSLDATQ